MWNLIKSLIGAEDSTSAWGSDGSDASCDINPATGLPMIGGCGGIDVYGNPYGADLHDGIVSNSFGDSFSSDSFGSDDWSSSGSSWDD
jgi:hypothetical protein